MHEFLDILRDGEVKKKMLGTVSEFWKEIEGELKAYDQEQGELIDKCDQKLFDYYKMGKKFRSKDFPFFFIYLFFKGWLKDRNN